MAMDRFPFSTYDFFGYLASGFAALAGIALITDRTHFLTTGLPASVFIVATAVAYILGHVVAHLAGAFLESLVARRMLSAPEQILLQSRTGQRTRRAIFRGYYSPLPEEVRLCVQTRATEKDWGEEPRAIFLRALTVARRDPTTAARLEGFLNLYGFCRNVAMTLLIVAAGLVASAIYRPDSLKPFLAIATAIAGVVMFLRFLKFYRLYTQEVFLASTETT